MSGIAVRPLLVRRLVHAPARVPGRDGDNAAQSLERRLHAPEAAAGKRGNRAAWRGRGGEERERSEDEKDAFHGNAFHHRDTEDTEKDLCDLCVSVVISLSATLRATCRARVCFR